MDNADEIARLKAAAERAQKGYHHDEAVGYYTEALEIAPEGDDPDAQALRYELHFGRGESYEWIGDNVAAMADFEAAVRLVEASAPEEGDLTRQVEALSRLAALTLDQVGVSEAENLAQKAMDLARQVGDTSLEADNLDKLANILGNKGAFAEASELRQQALALYRQTGDKAGEARVLYRLAFAAGRQKTSQANIDQAQQAVALARQAGDRLLEAQSLNVQGTLTQDLAKKRAYHEQALTIVQALGYRLTQSSITNNLALTCTHLGLYRRGLAYAASFISLYPDSPLHKGLYADICGLNALGLGLVDQAEAAWVEGLQVTRQTNNKRLEIYCLIGLGLAALARDQAAEAVQNFGDLIPYLRQSESAHLSHVLAWLAAAYLDLGQIEAAEEASAEAIELFEAGVVSTEYSRSEIWWHRYRVLEAAGADEAAWEALDRARAEMLETVAKMSDEGLRRNYFNKVAVNRQIIQTWLAEATGRDLALEPLTDGLTGASDLQEQFRRLSEIGVRLNTRQEERDLPAFILDEFVELTGAEEAAVILGEEVESARVAAADMAQGRAESLVQETAQLLDETGLKRQPRLMFRPDNAAKLDQSSILCVPLVVHNKTIGWLYAELSGIYGRFTLQDQDLVSVLANQAAVAIENSNWAGTLEQKVEQRTAELAIINSVQEGLAAELDIQAIYDLVGDKIQEIFDAQAVLISGYDASYETRTTYYHWELGERHYFDPSPLNQLHKSMVERREVLVVNENAEEELRALGAELVPGTEMPQSAVFVPLISGERLFGVISLQDLNEHAYSDSDVRLLTTLANSMSVALENARLFGETSQRAAELSIINSVQEGLAAELDIQAIYDLVGDQIQAIFDAQVVLIAGYDEEYETGIVHYGWEKGERLYFEPSPVNQLHKNIIERHEVLVFNENCAEQLYALGTRTMPGTEEPLSAVFVPLISGERVFGAISLQNVDREHAFGEGDVRLLTTLANSMSVALENARLFDETQRLLKETEQRNAELALINSVQEGLASKLDIQAIYDLVGDELRDIFEAETTFIAFHDERKEEVVAPYYVDRGSKQIITRPYDAGLYEHVVETGQPVLIGTQEQYKEIGAYHVKSPGATKDLNQSLIGVPILKDNKIIGVTSVQRYKRNAYDENDVRLLTTLTSSMSVALENARLFNETQRLLKETEQRNAELAIINSVQEGLVAQVDFQGIIDLVGGELRDVFETQDISIRLYDRRTGLVTTPYDFEHGRRLDIPDLPISGLNQIVIESRQPLVINNPEEATTLGLQVMPGTDMAKSMAAVPILLGNQSTGLVKIENHEHEDAFAPSDVRLMQTVANSMSVALENARLFDETNQRAAELAIINSVQEGLAAELDIQAIYELVGDTIQEIFDAQSLIIMGYDEAYELKDGHYIWEKGERYYGSGPGPLNQLDQKVVRQREVLVFNENAKEDMSALGAGTVPGTEEVMSAVFAPLISGDRVFGYISLQNVDREHAFSESDVRLLTTLANSMSVALENARLFNETQRLLAETEQRNTELAIINGVQQGLVAQVDFQGIIELVGQELRQVFDTQDIAIRLYDHETGLVNYPYDIEHGRRLAIEPSPLGGLNKAVIDKGKPLVINAGLGIALSKLGATLVPGTDMAKSLLAVPILLGGRATGLIILENHEREQAFSDSNVRLLETLANSMSVALENARLFDETQRLLKETEERAQELAIINSVQAGLAEQLEIQAVFDLVGD
ncbi:MAG: GAF domain-containing protein, partial [Chloroflexota bacterium]